MELHTFTGKESHSPHSSHTLSQGIKGAHSLRIKHVHTLNSLNHSIEAREHIYRSKLAQRGIVSIHYDKFAYIHDAPLIQTWVHKTLN